MPESTVPQFWAEAIADIQERLGAIKATLDATHEQATKTNGHVDNLYKITGDHAVHIAGLETAQEDFGRRLNQYDSFALRALGYGWRVALCLAGFIGGLLGLKNLLGG